MRKISFEELNKVNSIIIPGSPARIYLTYKRPQKNDQSGSISVIVTGWITVNKQRFPFKGTLVKNVGTDFRPSEDLSNSIESANTKAGSPLSDIYGILSDKVVDGVPYDAMSDFFAGIRKRKSKPDSKKNTENKNIKNKTDEPQIPKKQSSHAKIRFDKLSKEHPDVYQDILSKYPDIQKDNIVTIETSNQDKAVIVFRNKTKAILTLDYLERVEIPESLEVVFDRALSYYEDNKNDDNLNINVADGAVDRKEKMGLPLDDRDKYWKQKSDEHYEKKKPKDSWVKNLFKGNK